MSLDSLLPTIINNPVYLAISVVIFIALIFSIIKQLFKFAAIFIVLLIAYFGYLHYTGQEMPISKEELINNFDKNSKEVIEDLEGTVEDLKNKTQDMLKDIIDEKIKEKLQ